MGRSSRHCRAARTCTSDDGLHDLRSAVADLESESVAEPLLHHAAVVATVPEHEQALVNGVVRELWCPPLAHGRLRAMRRAFILEPERLQTQQARRLDLRVEIGQWMRNALKGR